jgi:hypothetical protein
MSSEQRKSSNDSRSEREVQALDTLLSDRQQARREIAQIDRKIQELEKQIK